MVKKLISRAEFARQAGVSGAAVTKACSSILKDAVVGKRLDAAHPAALQYLAEKELSQTAPAAIGLDPLYEPAVKFCLESGFYSITKIQREFKIGFDRAKSIIGVMNANGLINKKPETVVIKPGEIEAAVEKLKKPHVRGPAAAKETKKREAFSEEGILEIPEDIQAFGHMTLFDLIEKFGTDGRFVDWLSATQKIEAINEKRLKNASTEGELVSRKLVRTGIIEPIDACHIKLLTDGAKTIARRSTAMAAAGRPVEDVEKFVAEQITSFIRPVKSKVARALKNA
tara:strand:- start:2026 stop:2880 length:855 start_codon:yes stop_codon:yes gene_type:complete